MTKISIVLPVYNGEKTIQSTIESLLAQTYTDFELLVCIDGTKDGSEQIIDGLKDERIKLIQNEHNMGLGRTLNRLVSNSHADATYIAMAEQDDYYYPQRLMLEYQFMEANPDCGMVSGIAEHWDGERVTSKFPGLLVAGNNYPDDNWQQFILHYTMQVKVVNTCMLFRKAVHIANGLYFSMHYPSISVDWSYILRFSLVGKISGIPEVLVRMDRRKDRTSLTKQKTKQFEAAREVIRSFYYEHKDRISSREYKKALTTEYLVELGNMRTHKKLIHFIPYFLKDPGDDRWLPFLKKTLLR